MNITWVSEIVNIVVVLQSPDWVKMLYVRGHERGNPFYLRYLSRPVIGHSLLTATLDLLSKSLDLDIKSSRLVISSDRDRLYINTLDFLFRGYTLICRALDLSYQVIDYLVHVLDLLSKAPDFLTQCPPRSRRVSGLDFGSEDPGSIPRLPSPRVGPLMARR